MNFPVTDINGNEVTKSEYEAYTAKEAREHGFYKHPAAVYETVKETVATGLDKKERITLYPTATIDDKEEKVPVGTTLYGREQSRVFFSDVTAQPTA